MVDWQFFKTRVAPHPNLAMNTTFALFLEQMHRITRRKPGKISTLTNRGQDGLSLSWIKMASFAVFITWTVFYIWRVTIPVCWKLFKSNPILITSPIFIVRPHSLGIISRSLPQALFCSSSTLQTNELKTLCNDHLFELLFPSLTGS